MTRRTAGGLLAWLLAVAVATAVAIAAVSVIGSGIVGSGPQPLSQSEVDAGRPPPVSAGTGSSTTSAPPPADSTKVFPVQGGTVAARCAGDLVEIVSAVPAQGFQVSADREADDHPKVRFRSGRADFEVRLRCVGGMPQVEQKR